MNSCCSLLLGSLHEPFPYFDELCLSRLLIGLMNVTQYLGVLMIMYVVLRFDDGLDEGFSEILMIANLGEELLHVLDYFSAYGDWGFG